MKNTFKVGLDIHGVIDAFPEKFKRLSEALVKDGAEVHIITGSKRGPVAEKKLADAGIRFTHYFSIVDYLAGDNHVEWKEGLPYAEGDRWDVAKRDYCKRQGIDLMIDDSPVYRDTFSEIDTTFLHLAN